MTGVISRVWIALCADRHPRDAALRLIVALFIAVSLWSCACAFLLMEPAT